MVRRKLPQQVVHNGLVFIRSGKERIRKFFAIVRYVNKEAKDVYIYKTKELPDYAVN